MKKSKSSSAQESRGHSNHPITHKHRPAQEHPYNIHKGDAYQTAQDYHKYAQHIEAMSERYNSMHKRVPLSKIKTHGDVSIAYNLAAERFKKAHAYENALEDYKKAYKNAYNRKIEEKIKEDIEYVQGKIKSRKKSSLDKIASSVDDFFSLFTGKKMVYLLISIPCFIFAIWFLSINITGDVIIGVSQRDSSLSCLLLFFCGFLFMFLYFIRK